MKKVVIAGASGFVGSKLVEALLERTDLEIVALSRSAKESNHPRLSWAKCDLFSVKQLEKVMEGCDFAYYLVHSMQPSARLDQANFLDYDLILADNFGRAARTTNVQKVVYLSGIIPDISPLSDHLLSRLEVEEVLAEYFPQFIFLRAGLILGKDGSSFNMLLNLVRRLPILVCPNWTTNISSPVYIDNVIDALLLANDGSLQGNQSYDLSSKDIISYYELLKYTAKHLKLKRAFLHFPLNVIAVSRLWVSLFSGASKMLVYPLLESLNHSMAPRPDRRIQQIETQTSEEAIAKVVNDIGNHQYQFSYRVIHRKTVRSVQRFDLPDQMSAKQVAAEYIAWLPRFLFPFIKVTLDGFKVNFSFMTAKIKLLELTLSQERSTDDRQILYVTGGLLAGPQENGRLEFRSVLNNKHALAAIHDFKPALPWFIYIYSQAIIHLIVMKAFGRHLRKISEGKKQVLVEWVE
jgi:uncharacterized protein YbjT (DUF2867 family)